MDQIVNLVGGGLKCDNPQCDYIDMSVKIEDYKDWVNKPCPLCGSNLLTEQDFASVLAIITMVNSINESEQYYETNEEDINLHIRFNGTGKVDIDKN